MISEEFGAIKILMIMVKDLNITLTILLIDGILK